MSRYIPPELIPNILARLPVKDVLRCTIVCRSWYTLVTCSSFTSLHLKLSTPNQTPPVLIHYILASKSHFTLLDQNQTLIKISGVDPLLEDGFRCIIIGSFNGLLLLYSYYSDTLVLWNPSLRKTLILPKPGLSEHVWHEVGFGFLPATNDYKIVMLSYRDHDLKKFKVKGRIYELSTGSWRDIVNADNIPYIAYAERGQALLKDNIHWPARSRDDLTQLLIGSFNLNNESFGTLMVPSLLRDFDFFLSTFQESLCLFNRQGRCCIIWVMKEYGVTDSWTKQFKIKIDIIGYMVGSLIYLGENGEFLLETWVDDNDQPYHVVLVLYDSVNNTVIKNIHRSNGTMFNFIGYSYMESLVLIKGPVIK